MNTLMLIVSLSCPATKMINKMDFPWNAYDSTMLEYARNRCPKVFPDAPCVAKFIKHDKQGYSVICGEKK